MTNSKKKFFTKRNIFIMAMLAYPIIQFIVFWVIVNVNTVVLSLTWKNPMTGDVDFVGLRNYKYF